MLQDSTKTEFCVIAPENLDKLDSPLGKLRRGRAMFCGLSQTQVSANLFVLQGGSPPLHPGTTFL